VLRPIRLGDSSKIVSALTPTYGRVKLVAKGSRRLDSRLSPLLESGNELDLVLYPRPDRDLWMLGDASLVRAVLTGGNTLNKLSHLLAAMDLADRLLPEREPVPEFEALYRAWLDYWHKTADEGQAGLFFALELALLEGAGTGLDPTVCSACAQSLSDGLRDLQVLAGDFMSGGPREWPRLEAATRQQIGRLLHEHMALHMPGYRLPASLYWLAPQREGRGTNR